MSEEELIKTLRAFEKDRVEQLEEPARNLFYAIMKIADERDRLNNIINELDKRCNDMIKFWKTFTDEEKFNNWKEYRIYETILKWIEELKER